MLAPWATEEMENVQLEDRRLSRRLAQILSALGARPTASIPAACGGYAEMTAAYRFFANDKVSWQRILQPHFERSRQRAAAHDRILLVQDTSELDLTRPQQQVRGAGPLAGATRRGVFLHPLEAFTTDGTPLGAVWAEMWSRTDEDATPQEKKQRRREAPIEEKESYRWLEGLRQARAVAQELPRTTCVCVADSEADVYELFAEPRGERPVHWLIRASHPDRTVTAGQADAGAVVRHLREQILAGTVLLDKEVPVRARQAKVSCDKRSRRQPRQGRTARVAVRAGAVTLQPPRRPDRELPPVTVNVVLATEVDPPANDEPVEWLLLTTLPVDDAEQVREVLESYATRFLIEVYFRVLKSGCRVEERLFEDIDRLLPCAAVYLVVAWRVLMLCRLGRSCPELDCEAIFEEAEWRSVWAVVRRTEPPPSPPKLAEMLRMVARLGGYVERANRSDPPGPQTLWLGLQRTYDLALAWNTFGPGAAKRPRRKDV
jgi:Transposase DNA-binding/Transposase Tn5 dimerisation domain